MKKGLFVISIITGILSVISIVYASMLFYSYIQGIITGKAGQEFFSVLFYIIFGFIAVGVTGFNFVINLIHLIKCKKPIVIIFFVIATILFIAAVAMLMFVYIRGNT